MSFLAVVGVFLGAGLLSGLVVVGSIRVAGRFNFVDEPDGDRKSQERPVPKLGGLAVAFSFSATVLVALLILGEGNQFTIALSVLGPAIGLALVGFFDDRAHLNPYLRLFLQAGFALLAWMLGTQLVVTGTTALDAVAFVIWVMVIVNGINLLDNSDGLAASTVFISTIGISIIAWIFGQELVALMALALAGTAVGFLMLNWFPARVYLGDAGAYFLGFLLAVLAVRLRPEGVPAIAGISMVILLLLLPLIDTFYVVTKRLAKGIHPFTAGRDHLSHVLQGNDKSIPESVLVLQGISVIGVAGAIVIALVSR